MTAEIITTVDLCDALKSLIGNDTPYGVHKFLGSSTSSAYNWCDGKTVMDEPYAIKAALALKMDPDFVLACLAAERAAKGQHSDTAAVWKSIALRLSTAASISFLAVLVAIMTKSPII